MSITEFLSMTPRQFEALRARHDAAKKNDWRLFELMMAQQAALTYNTRMTYDKEPRKMAEFMPSTWGEVSRQRPVSRRVRRSVVCDQFRTILKMHNVPITPGA